VVKMSGSNALMQGNRRRDITITFMCDEVVDSLHRRDSEAPQSAAFVCRERLSS